MATTTHGVEQRTVSGWAIGFSVFAGSLMMLGGIFQALEGLAAIFTNDFFVVGQNYLYQIDVTTWGWIHLVVGSIVALAGMFVFAGAAWARGVGIALAIVSAIANFFYIPYYPIWSLLIIALDIAVIWALASVGTEEIAQLESDV